MKKSALLGLLVFIWCVFPLLPLEPPAAGELDRYRLDGTLSQRLAFAHQLGNFRTAPRLVQRADYNLKRLYYRSQGLSDAQIDAICTPPSGWIGMPTTGTVNVLALLISFADYPPAAADTPAVITEKLFGTPAATPTPSGYPYETLRNFYRRSSSQQLDITGTVLGWYNTGANRSNVSMTTLGREDLIRQALQYYDTQGQDFSRFDNDGDGAIDYLVVIWTGPDNGWANFWWGYQTAFSTNPSFRLDGKALGTYSWQWESRPYGNLFSPKVVIHETGHALGLPDYYDYNDSVGPRGGVGDLDQMDGNWGDHNAFSKFLLDWITPAVHSSGSASRTLRGASATGDALIVMNGASATPFAEYFMVQNRHRDTAGNDLTYPGDGLLIWHVDARLNAYGSDYLYDNSYTDHKLLRLMEADGLEEIEQNQAADAGDYYVAGKTFSPSSTPNSNRYDGTVSQVRIKNISAAGSTMTFLAAFSDATLQLTAPNGGESWQKGTSQSITWQASGLSGTVTLELWHSGAKVGTIAENLALTPASYSWTVGNFVGGSAAPGGGYTVRIVGTGVSDASDASFAIWTPGLTVTSPNGGETWTRHQSRPIQWSSLGLSGNVKVELLQNGSPLGVIANSVPISAGAYTWDVGFVNGAFPAAGSTYSIRVTTADNLYSDASDAAFTLANRAPVLPAASDFNGDGKTDIFWHYNSTGGFNCVWLMGLAGAPTGPMAAFSAPAIDFGTLLSAPQGRGEEAMESGAPGQEPAVLGNAPFTTAVDDVMDGDGPTADPPVADPRTLGYARTLPATALAAWRMGGVADFNGDGQADILWRNHSDGRNVVWCMNGQVIRSVTQLQVVANLGWEIGGVGDFNADGHVDIVWRNYTDGRVVIWLMERFTLKQTVKLPVEADPNWRITGVCDFTGDGSVDILWRNVSDGRNLVWCMNRVAQSSVASLPTVANMSWEMAAFGDFTGDGEMDIVWRHTGDGRVVVWKMDRFSLIGTVQLNPVSDANWKIENN